MGSWERASEVRSQGQASQAGHHESGIKGFANRVVSTAFSSWFSRGSARAFVLVRVRSSPRFNSTHGLFAKYFEIREQDVLKSAVPKRVADIQFIGDIPD